MESAFTAVDRFGNLGRNVVIGPAYHNTDLSLIKHTPLGGNVHLQLRADVFDLFNQPNSVRRQHRGKPGVRPDHEDAPADG